VLLAGRISEEIFLNMTTTGAGNDFEKATSIARKMVCEWGMSSLGPITFAKKEDMIFLGRDLMSHNEYSEETSQMIDIEIKKIIDQAYANAKKIILENREKMETIAMQLLEKESLTSDDIAAILGTPSKPNPQQAKKRKPRSATPPPATK
jgi:cell division protease FtsH